MLRIVHRVLELLHSIYRVILHYGPAVLSKYTSQCAWLLCGMCVAAGLYDLLRRRRADAALWAVLSVLLYAAFQTESVLADPRRMEQMAILAVLAITVSVFLMARSLPELFRS